MIDRIAEFIIYASFWGPVAVFVLVVANVRGVSVARRIAVSIVSALAAFVLLTGFWMGVWLRDGLGPGMVSSVGWEAVVRSVGLIIGGVVLAALLSAVAVWLVRSAPRHSEGQAL